MSVLTRLRKYALCIKGIAGEQWAAGQLGFGLGPCWTGRTDPVLVLLCSWVKAGGKSPSSYLSTASMINNSDLWIYHPARIKNSLHNHKIWFILYFWLLCLSVREFTVGKRDSADFSPSLCIFVLTSFAPVPGWHLQLCILTVCPPSSPIPIFFCCADSSALQQRRSFHLNADWSWMSC